eukprot:GSChrysophyteH1.ASY1.ANO1.2314.1 assembled CDS
MPQLPLPVDSAGTVDIWRDSGLRYLGYANEIGEAFRPLLPKVVAPSYLIAFGYVIGDTYSKFASSERTISSSRYAAGLDAFIWQTFASVLVPGATINFTTKATKRVLMQSTIHSRVSLFGPTIVGLAMIPLIIHPIDESVTKVMDLSCRKWYFNR